MSVVVRVVEKYDDEVFKDLVHRNLESAGVFIPAWDYQESGDATFSKQGRKIRVAAFDGDTLVGLSFGKALTKNRFMMHMPRTSVD